MSDVPQLLRRHGLTLVFVAALVGLYLTQTRPALALRAELRAQRADAERELQHELDNVRRVELWRSGIQNDELLRERALDDLQRSPDRRGARILPRVSGDQPGEHLGEHGDEAPR
ncbi:MAG: hypothetical protein DHS20C15_10950 [Planctomycetota bacterium]|nr:MAG: hypothetical protein DHS20C15_10950 [Planctomycetota bacterium]